MMLNKYFLIAGLMGLIIPFRALAQKEVSNQVKDGVFTGTSRSVYTNEEYWGSVKLTVKNGVITDVTFVIRDSSLHETFNQGYARHFEGNDLYIRQTEMNLEGMKNYQAKLLKTQDIEKVDVISGATWAYNIFRDAARQALKE